MHRSAFVMFAAVVGCGNDHKTTGSTFDVDNGGFYVEFDDGGRNVKIDTTAADDGKGTKYRRHEVVWMDGTRRLTVENGVLSVDGKSRGEIKRGARIHVNATGEISVKEP